MAKTIRGLSIEIGGDTSKLGQALKNVNETARTFNKELKDIDKSLKLDPKNVELLSQKQEVLTKAIQNTSDKLGILKKAEEEARREFEKGSMSEEQYRKLQREVINTSNQLESMKDRLKEINSIDFEKLGNNLKDVGGKLTKFVTLPLAGMATASIKFAMDFEQSMAKVNTIADTTQKPIKEIGDEILELSNRTGIASTELAESVYQAISAGVSTSNAVKLVEIATKSAVAGFTDSTTAVDGLTTVINSYGMSMEEAERLANKFLITQNLGKTTFGELANSIGKVAPIASTLNVTTDELLSSLASLTANGINTSEAITSLKAAYSNIIKPTTEAQKIAKQLGLEFDSNAIKTKGWAGFLEDLQKKTGGNVETMSKLFGSTEAVNTILSLTSDNGMALLNKSLTTMETNTTTLNDAFNKMQDTTQSKLNKGLQQLKNSSIELGGALLPIANKIIDAISGLVNWFNKLDGTQKTMVATTGLVVAGIGPLISLLGSLSLAFGVALGPMGLLIAGLSLLTAGVSAYLIATSKVPKEIQTLNDSFKSTEQVIEDVDNKFKQIEENTAESMRNLRGDFLNTLNELSKGVEKSELNSKWKNLLGNFEQTLDVHKQAVSEKYALMQQGILDNVILTEEQRKKALDKLREEEKNEISALNDNYDNAYKQLQEVVGKNLEGLNNLTSDKLIELDRINKEFLGNLPQNIADFDYGDAGKTLNAKTTALMDEIIKAIQEGKKPTKEQIEQFKNLVVEEMQSTIDEIDKQIQANQLNITAGIFPIEARENIEHLTKLKESILNGSNEILEQLQVQVPNMIDRTGFKRTWWQSLMGMGKEEEKVTREAAQEGLETYVDSLKHNLAMNIILGKNEWKNFQKETVGKGSLEGIKEADKTIQSEMKSAGTNAYKGYESGSANSKYSALGKSNAKSYKDAFNKEMEIKSPSRVSEKAGKFTLEGFFRGNNAKKYLEQGIKNAKAYTEAFNSSLNTANSLNQSISSISPTPEKTFNLHVGTLINNTDKDTEALANDINFLIRRDNLK